MENAPNNAACNGEESERRPPWLAALCSAARAPPIRIDFNICGSLLRLLSRSMRTRTLNSSLRGNVWRNPQRERIHSASSHSYLPSREPSTMTMTKCRFCEANRKRHVRANERRTSENRHFRNGEFNNAAEISMTASASAKFIIEIHELDIASPDGRPHRGSLASHFSLLAAIAINPFADGAQRFAECIERQVGV